MRWRCLAVDVVAQFMFFFYIEVKKEWKSHKQQNKRCRWWEEILVFLFSVLLYHDVFLILVLKEDEEEKMVKKVRAGGKVRKQEMKWKETARLQLEKEKSSTVKVFMKEVSFWLYFRGESGSFFFFFKTSCCLWSKKVAFSLVQQLHAWIWKRFWLTRDSWLVQNQKCTVTAVIFKTLQKAVDSKVALKQQAAGKWEIIRREREREKREERGKKERQHFASHLRRVNE